MPRFVDAQTNLTGGQVDPAVQSRSDIDLYKKAVALAKNCLLRVTGGMTNRPGTTALAPLFTGATGYTSKIFPFIFNDDQRYIVIINRSSGATTITIKSTEQVAGVLVACTVTFTASAPWLDAEIDEVRWTQLGDTMIFFHKNHQPRVLKRTGATTFTLTLFAFTASQQGYPHSPKLPIRNDLGFEVRIHATSGAAVELRSNPTTGCFSSGDVGKWFWIEGIPFVVTSYINSGYVQGNFGNGKGQAYIQIFSAVNPVGLFSINETAEQDDGAGVFGTTYVGDVVDIQAASITCRSVNNINVSVGNAMRGIDTLRNWTGVTGGSLNANWFQEYWLEEVYNADNGWPACGTFHEGRLWIGGGDTAPFHVFGSKSGDYYDFDTGDGRDNESIAVPCISDSLSELLHLHSGDSLMAFTDGGMLYAPSTEDSPLSPSNTRFLSQNKYASSDIAPFFFDKATISIQENNRTIRENLYEFTTQKSESVPISLTAGSMIGNLKHGTALYAINEKDEQYAFFLNDAPTATGNSELAVFHSIRDEGIRAWVPWSLGEHDDGVIPRQIDAIQAIGRELYMIYKYSNAASSVNRQFMLAKLDFDETLDMASVAVNVSGTTWRLPTAFALTSLHGLKCHCTMKDTATGEFYYLGEVTPDGSGQFTLPVTGGAETGPITIGWKFETEIQPLPLSKIYTDGDVLVDVKRVSALTLDLIDTKQMFVDDQKVNPNVSDTFPYYLLNHNVLDHSYLFNTSTWWTKSGVTVTEATVTDSDGNLKGATLTESVGTFGDAALTYNLSEKIGPTYPEDPLLDDEDFSFSVEIKKGVHKYAYVEITTKAVYQAGHVYIDLETNQIETDFATVGTWQVIEKDDGWLEIKSEGYDNATGAFLPSVYFGFTDDITNTSHVRVIGAIAGYVAKAQVNRGLEVLDYNEKPLVTGTGPVEYTGFRKFYLLGWDYKNDISITNDLPLPFHIRSIIREVEI